MSKDDTQDKLVPRLRFPEFRDVDAWVIGRCGDVANVLQGYGFPERHQGSDKGLYPFYKVSDISASFERGEKYIDQANNYIDEDVLSEIGAKPVPKGTTIFAKIGEAIRSNRRAITTKPSVVDNNVAGIKAISGKASDDFLYYLWSNISLIDFAGGVVPAISKSAIETIPIPYTEIGDEQRKIAACLGSMDNLIAAERRKLSALREHKRGLMQQLFPRQGETHPRLRFPEFQNAPEWNVVPLGKLLTRDPQYGVNAAAVPVSEKLPAYVRITDINDDGRYLPEGKVSVDIEATDDDYLMDGDIVLARTGASVGKSYRYRPEDGRLVFAGFLIRVRPKPAELDSRFLAAYLSTGQYWEWVRMTSARSGQPGINASEYAALPLPVPPDGHSKGEQKKVADCFVSLEALIAAQAKKLDALHTHKRGLMQQLFPSPKDHQ